MTPEQLNDLESQIAGYKSLLEKNSLLPETRKHVEARVVELEKIWEKEIFGAELTT